MKYNTKVYLNNLVKLANLSNLFSINKAPLLVSRSVERVFCHVFEVENLTRSDSSFDVKQGTLGIGIKTFLMSGKEKSEKIAEWNNKAGLSFLTGNNLAIKIAELRNERIKKDKNIYNIENGIYHLVTRKEGYLRIFECPYEEIDINSIEIIKDTDKYFWFKDKKSIYSFSRSKTTLFKKFILPNKYESLKIDTMISLENILEKI